MALVLASESPRRRELMSLLTNCFDTDQAAIDESVCTAKIPEELAVRLAKAKAETVFQRRNNDSIIGCDTVVDLKGLPLGKPANEDEAQAMLRSLAGRRHFVHTGVCVIQQSETKKVTSFVNTTAVDFTSIPLEEIEKYVKTQEPYDKAGGYAVQGWAARYITRIEGCYYNVMGLPVAALHQILLEMGIL